MYPLDMSINIESIFKMSNFFDGVFFSLAPVTSPIKRPLVLCLSDSH